MKKQKNFWVEEKKLEELKQEALDLNVSVNALICFRLFGGQKVKSPSIG